MDSGLLNLADDNVFEVEKIIKKRCHPAKGVLYYVKWKHFPNSANTWEPACNFSRKLIDDYESSHPSKRVKLSTGDKSPVTATASGTTTTTTTTSSSSSSTTTASTPRTASITTTTKDTPTTTTGQAATSTSQEQQKEQKLQRHADRLNQKPIMLEHCNPTPSSRTSNNARQQLVVFNPVGDHTLPIIDQVTYEPQLTKEPIVVTDVTAKDLTVTISECKTSKGFFNNH